MDEANLRMHSFCLNVRNQLAIFRFHEHDPNQKSATIIVRTEAGVRREAVLEVGARQIGNKVTVLDGEGGTLAVGITM